MPRREPPVKNPAVNLGASSYPTPATRRARAGNQTDRQEYKSHPASGWISARPGDGAGSGYYSASYSLRWRFSARRCCRETASRTGWRRNPARHKNHHLCLSQCLSRGCCTRSCSTRASAPVSPRPRTGGQCNLLQYAARPPAER